MRHVRNLIEEVLTQSREAQDRDREFCYFGLEDLAYTAGEEIGMTKQELDKLARGYSEDE